MKYLILTAMTLGGVLSLRAAETDGFARNRYIATDPVYLQLYGGINKSANENLPWKEFSEYPWSGGLFVGIGKEITPQWGWRAAFRYNHNKSRNVQKCESPDTWGWDNLGLFGDVTFDVTDVFSHSDDCHRRWNTKLFAGIGAAYTFGFDDVPLSYRYPYSRNSRFLLGARAGVTTTFQISPTWRVGAELSHNFYADRFNGVKADFPLDGRTNLKVGLTYLFGKHPEKSRSVEESPVVNSRRLRVVPQLPILIPEVEKVKKRQISGRAFIDFPVNEMVIYPNYRRNPQELKRIITTVDSALFDKSTQVTSISLHGYASPESPYSNNTRLSQGRVAALRDYLQNHYHFEETVFTLSNTPEDWQNLRDYIEQGNRRRVKGDIWYESMAIFETPETPDVVLKNRDELLRVIDLQMDEDEKELLLKKVGGGEPYQWLYKYVYPGLRHTDYIIEYVVGNYHVKDAKRLIYTHPEALSLNEMYQVANSYEQGSDEWLDALLIAAKQYPHDHTANLNAACACLMVRRIADAKRYMEKAGISANARYVNDVIRAMEGSASWVIVDGKVVISE